MDLGDQAPDFELRDQHGQQVRLSETVGTGLAAVVFFPYAFSRVCTGELADAQAVLPGSRRWVAGCWPSPATRCTRCERSPTGTG